MPPKRKTPSTPYADSAGTKSNKRSKASQLAPQAFERNGTARDNEADGHPQFDHSRPKEKSGTVQREFYPPEMSNEHCAMYNANEIPRPIKVLEATLSNTTAERAKIGVGEAVVHWFKRDLRLRDNKALSLAAAKAKEKEVPLICMFSVSPQDYQAHLTSALRWISI